MIVVGLEGKCNTWRKDQALELIVIINSSSSNELQFGKEFGFRLQVGTYLVDTVIFLINAVDCAFCIGTGQQNIQTISKALTRPKTISVLNLSNIEIRIIDGWISASDDISISSITPIPKGLGEEIFVNKPSLEVTIGPVLGLTGTDASQFNTGGLRKTAGNNRCCIVVGAIINTKFTAGSVSIKYQSACAFKILFGSSFLPVISSKIIP